MRIKIGKIKKFMLTVLTVFMAAVFAFDVPLKIVALEESKFSPGDYTPEQLEEKIASGSFTTSSELYISDLMMATATTPQAAKDALHEKGFIVYDANLNEGSGTNSGVASATEYYTYLGYKLTANEDEGITGIRTMDQKGGYQEFDYKKFFSNGLEGFSSLVSGMQSACAEFKKRYDAGDEAARIAKRRLDLFVVPATSKEKTGISLGDYLLNPNLKREEVEDMILVLDGLILGILNDELSMGVTSSSLQKTQAFNGYVMNTTWLTDAYDAVASCQNFSTINVASNDYWRDLDNRFGKEAEDLVNSFLKGADETALAYLDTIPVNLRINDKIYWSFPNFFQYAPKRAIELFVSKLPKICLGGRFADVVNLFASNPNDGIPTGTYTSLNGVVSCTGLTDGGNWIKDAYDAAKAITETDESYWIDLEANYGAELKIFRNAAKNAAKSGTLSEEAIAYLKGISLDGMNAYTFLTEGNEDTCHAFFASLEKQHDVCLNRYFIDMLEICATDYAHRIPTGFHLDRHYTTDWVTNVKNSINANPYNTTTAKKLYDLGQDSKEEIDSFVDMLTLYMQDYKPAEERFLKSGESVMEQFAEMEKKSRSKGLDKLLSEPAEDQKMPDFYFITTGALLKDVGLNDGSTLFDYFSGIYDAFKSSDAKENEKGYALAYPVVSALTKGQKYFYQTRSFLLFLSSIARSEFETSVIEANYRYEKDLLTKAFKSEQVSVWYASNKDLLELGKDDFLAITSSKVRQEAAKAELDSLWEKPADYQEVGKILSTVGEIAIAVVSIALALVPLMAQFIGVGIGAMFIAFWAGATVAAGVAAATTFATVCTIISSVTIALTVIVIVVLIVVALIYLIVYEIEYYTISYSEQPTVLLDSELTENNDVIKTSIIKYYAVRDPDGNPADANALHGKKWTTLYYTKDKRIGSPLTVGPHGAFFADQKGKMEKQEGAFPIAKFGQTLPFNMNNNCYYDTIGGHYFWYYTEESITGKSSTDTDEYKYVSDIMIVHALTDKEAQLAINRTEGYYLLNVDLSPNNGTYHTYLGYKKTNKASSALTDIRVNFASASETILYGEATYSNIQAEDQRVVPATTCEAEQTARSQTNFSYAVYVTKDSLAGYPILADSFEVVDSIQNIPEDRDVISMFAGGAHDFNSWDKEGKKTFEKHRFVTYKGEGKKTNNDVYLAGLAFFSGTYDWPGGSYVEKNPTEYAKALGYTIVEGIDPVKDYPYNSGQLTHLAYVTTRDPKRALTDIGVFTSEPRSLYLPDAISCATAGYSVCQVYSQGDIYYYGGVLFGAPDGYNQRMMRYSHAYLTAVSSEIQPFVSGSWTLLPDTKICIKPRGLYAAGPVSGNTPIRLADVVFSTSNLYLPRNENREKISNITEDKNLVYWNFGTGWKSVHPLDQYYYDTYDKKGNITSCFNIGAPRKNATSSDNGIYIFYKNGTPDRVRGNYVQSVEIVGDQTKDGSYNTARLYGMAYGTDIINLNNPIQMYSDIIMDPTDENPLYTIDDTDISGYGDGCIYVTVKYTNNINDALGSIRILEQSTATGELPSAIDMPLDNSNTMSEYQKGKNVAPYLAPTEESKTDSKKDTTKKFETGLVMYTTKNGIKTNSLSVRTIPITAASELIGGTNNLLGSAEYYLPLGNGSDPFRIANYPLGIAFCVCAERYDAEGASALAANFKYIESISVVTEKSFDGSVGLAAAALGASQYPFVINCDVTEGALQSGDNRVVAIGVKRTGNAREAIKDIKITTADYGLSFEYLGRSYSRVNDFPINDLFIYTTKDDGTKELLAEYIDWHTINPETANLANFDFTKLNWLTIDKTFQYKWVDQNDPDIIAVQNYQYSIEKAFAPELSAITNLGFIPLGNTDGSQNGVFWAGRASKNNAQSIVPITSETVISNVQTFDGTTAGMKLVYTNGANKGYDDFVVEAKKNLPSLTGSAFADFNQIWIIVILSVISLAAVAIAVFAGRKRRQKNA